MTRQTLQFPWDDDDDDEVFPFSGMKHHLWVNLNCKSAWSSGHRRIEHDLYEVCETKGLGNSCVMKEIMQIALLLFVYASNVISLYDSVNFLVDLSRVCLVICIFSEESFGCPCLAAKDWMGVCVYPFPLPCGFAYEKSNGIHIVCCFAKLYPLHLHIMTRGLKKGAYKLRLVCFDNRSLN